MHVHSFIGTGKYDPEDAGIAWRGIYYNNGFDGDTFEFHGHSEQKFKEVMEKIKDSHCHEAWIFLSENGKFAVVPDTMFDSILDARRLVRCCEIFQGFDFGWYLNTSYGLPSAELYTLLVDQPQVIPHPKGQLVIYRGGRTLIEPRRRYWVKIEEYGIHAIKSVPRFIHRWWDSKFHR